MKIYNRLYKEYEKRCFLFKVKGIRKTPALKFRYDKNLKIISQVHHAAVDMYLIAIKSFMHYMEYGAVYILNDGSLTKSDIQLFKKHIPNVEIEHIDNIDTKECPRGGTWERLFYLIGLSGTAYVMQLDSDTITLRDPVEIKQMINNEQSFTVSSEPEWSEVVDVQFLSEKFKGCTNPHVQIQAEKTFIELDFFKKNNRYIRGCSAISGFAKNEISCNLIVDFSKQVRKYITSELWSQWGSEQVTSNVMVAQTSHPMVLPWPQYQNFKFPILSAEQVFQASIVHFIGSHRFDEQCYEKLSMQLIALLNQK